MATLYVVVSADANRPLQFIVLNYFKSSFFIIIIIIIS